MIPQCRIPAGRLGGSSFTPAYSHSGKPGFDHLRGTLVHLKINIVDFSGDTCVCGSVVSPWRKGRMVTATTKGTRKGGWLEKQGDGGTREQDEMGAPVHVTNSASPRRNLAFHLRFPPVLLGRRSCKLHLRPS